MEAVIAREVLTDWNALHSRREKIALLPEPSEPLPDEPPGDVLVAIFCALHGAMLPSEAEAIETAIDRELQAGRPVFAFCSEASSNLNGRAPQSAGAGELRRLKERYNGLAALDSFGDEKEFRARFAGQLEATVPAHPYFHTAAAVGTEKVVAGASAAAAPLKLSAHAERMLMEACDDPEAYIGRFEVGAVFKIQVNGRQLVDPAWPGEVEHWRAAFAELLDLGLIRDAGCQGRLFQISPRGFQHLKTLGKTPVGYIAELGGM
jgi:hypothetical protein